jgi:orotate phosphoribosyltransferase
MNTRIVEALTDKKGETTKKLRAGQNLLPSERVVIVASVTTTGGSINQCISIVKEHEALLSAICIFATRNDRAIQNIKDFLEKELPGSEVPIYVILNFKGEEWNSCPKSECPICKQKEPFEYAKDVR